MVGDHGKTIVFIGVADSESTLDDSFFRQLAVTPQGDSGCTLFLPLLEPYSVNTVREKHDLGPKNQLFREGQTEP